MLGRLRSATARAAGTRGAQIAFALLFSVAVLGAAVGASARSTAETVGLHVQISSNGGAADAAIAVTPTPTGDTTPCTRMWFPCNYTVSPGTVTLTATPMTTPVLWSDPVCGSSHECTTTVADETSIVAIFLPVRLSIQMWRGTAGGGVVKVTKVGCVGADCATECSLGELTSTDCKCSPPVLSGELTSKDCSIPYPTITDV
jgi:hypothetical protein